MPEKKKSAGKGKKAGSSGAGKKKKKGSGGKKKKSKKATSKKEPVKPPDPFSPAAARNAYYICHTAVDFLDKRGFSWPDKPKTKKKGKKKKKK